MSLGYLSVNRLTKAMNRSRGLLTMLLVVLVLGFIGLLTGCSQPTEKPVQPTQAYNPHHPQCVQGLQVDNLVYAVKGRDTLTVDIYTDPATADGPTRPLLIYLYGGGFESGTRWDTSSDLVNFLPYMVREYGYVGAAIDYRVEFANARREGRVPADLPETNFFDPDYFCNQTVVDELITAKEMAVEDFMDATTFLLGLSQRYAIDTTRVIAAGSSAGALTLLGAEYHICNAHPMATQHLPTGFNYAALVPMAGGIWTPLNEPLHYDTPPCPMMLFHGDADQLVPYNRLDLPQYGVSFHGSRAIADLLAQMGVPYCMYTVVGGNHVINGSPTVTNREDIHAFIRRNVDMKTPWTMEIVERSLTVPHDYDWMAQEYILPMLEQHPEYAAQLASGEGDDIHRPGQSGD